MRSSSSDTRRRAERLGVFDFFRGAWLDQAR
jgi:hypothetical protein